MLSAVFLILNTILRASMSQKLCTIKTFCKSKFEFNKEQKKEEKLADGELIITYCCKFKWIRNWKAFLDDGFSRWRNWTSDNSVFCSILKVVLDIVVNVLEIIIKTSNVDIVMYGHIVWIILSHLWTGRMHLITPLLFYSMFFFFPVSSANVSTYLSLIWSPTLRSALPLSLQQFSALENNSDIVFLSLQYLQSNLFYNLTWIYELR